MNEGRELKRTPLYDLHVAAGAKMVPFAGWEMPLQYGSQIKEHNNTRVGAGLFDVSHMGQIEVTGEEAERLIQEIVTRDAAHLEDEQAMYCAMCREDGGLLDDLIVSRFAADHFLMVVNAAAYRDDVAFMQRIASRLGLARAHLIPCSGEWAMIALQGPEWRHVARRVLDEGAWFALPPYRVARLTFAGEILIYSTTGYTGEEGIELLCPPETAPELWQALVDAGAQPAGLAARDSLRLEKGLCLSGQDFTTENNPYEARLGWVVDLDKESFSGKSALHRIKAEGVERRLVGLLPRGRRMARAGATIWREGRLIGEVTSGCYSPSLERPIALGYVRAGLHAIGTELEIDLGASRAPAVVARLPFYPETED